MSETFFESPLYVYFALGLAELVLAVIWHEKRTRRWAISLAIPIVLAGVVVLVEHVVVTDREQITAAALDIADAIESRQLDRISPHLDDEFQAIFQGIPISKDGVISVCQSQISNWEIKRINFGRTVIKVDGRSATMHLNTFLVYGEKRESRTAMIWDIRWIEREAGWKMYRVSEPKQGFEF